MQLWEVLTKAQADAYDDEIDELLAQDGRIRKEEAEALKLSRKRLEEAKKYRPQRHWDHLSEHWTGAAREQTWRAIHEADVVLTYARPAAHIRAELPGLKEEIRLRVDDGLYREDLLERLKSVEGSLDEAAKPLKKADKPLSRPRLLLSRLPWGARTKTDADRQPSNDSSTTALARIDADRTAVAHVKRELYEISADGYESQRSFRNIIIVTSFVAAAVALLLAILGHYDNTIVNLLNIHPKSPATMWWPEKIWPIEFIGAFSGFIVGITALKRLSGLGPYSLRVTQATLKVPVGALTALAGMLLLQSGMFGIGPVHTKGDFVGWCFVFGASQELITRLVDQKAAAVTEKAKPTG